MHIIKHNGKYNPVSTYRNNKRDFDMYPYGIQRLYLLNIRLELENQLKISNWNVKNDCIQSYNKYITTCLIYAPNIL